MVIPKLGHPHPLTQSVVPVTTGHEFCGFVSEVPKCSPLKVGQPVIVDPRIFCGECPPCLKGATNSCRYWGSLGSSGGGGGGLSETVAVSASMCHVLPDSIPMEFAALLEPLAVAHHAVNNSRLQSFSNKSILVVGGGPIGMATLFILKSRGVKAAFVSEPSPVRREQIGEFATRAFDPIKEKVAEIIRELTADKGVDVVFDCAGIQAGIDVGMDALGHGGIYVNIAGHGKPVSLAPLPYSEFR